MNNDCFRIILITCPEGIFSWLILSFVLWKRLLLKQLESTAVLSSLNGLPIALSLQATQLWENSGFVSVMPLRKHIGCLTSEGVCRSWQYRKGKRKVVEAAFEVDEFSPPAFGCQIHLGVQGGVGSRWAVGRSQNPSGRGAPWQEGFLPPLLLSGFLLGKVSADVFVKRTVASWFWCMAFCLWRENTLSWEWPWEMMAHRAVVQALPTGTLGSTPARSHLNYEKNCLLRHFPNHCWE